MSKSNYKDYIGVDISKRYLDVCIGSTGEFFRTSNNASGFKEIKQRLSSYKFSLIAAEATGGYEREMVDYLQDAGFKVAVVNPRQVRNFGKALGKLAKTDKIDAAILAHFAEAIKPLPKEKTHQESRELNENQRRRQQLVEMLTMEKNRLAKTKGNVSKHIKKTIKFFEKQLEEIEKELAIQISENEAWSDKSKLLCSIKGVGETTAVVMIAELPELGQVSHKEIAALVGVAPLNCDSGNYKGERFTWGGRSRVRTALYRATLVAVRFNPPLKRFYEQLCQRGKKKKVALVACMRKLLTVMNAMVKKNILWQPALISH